MASVSTLVLLIKMMICGGEVALIVQNLSYSFTASGRLEDSHYSTVVDDSVIVHFEI